MNTDFDTFDSFTHRMCTIKTSILLICAFSLLFGISGTSEDPSSHVGGIRGERRYLGKKNDKDRKKR
jgi:hypothetical protein